MTLSVKDASGATQTIKTNDDMAGVAGTPSANVLSVQGVSGGSALAVAVSNLPATQAISGTVSVSNLPATQPVSGAVSVSNFPATQPVSGSVLVANLPATQAVSAATLPLPAGAASEASLGTIGSTPPALPGSSTGIMGLLRWIGTLFASGAGVASGALRVVVASDQAAIPEISPAAAYAERSGTITAGGTAQTLAAANTARRFYRVMNLSTGDLWINDKGTAAVPNQPSFKLVAGAMYEVSSCAPTSAISIFGATTGQAFSAAEA